MKGQAWALFVVVWAAVWVWADGAMPPKRSSDPNVIMNSIGAPLPAIPKNLVFGDPPNLASDVLGPPFNPNDFAPLDSQIAHDPVENPTGEDPILFAGRFEGDIILEGPDELMAILGQSRKGRNMIKDHSKKWPGGVVPYVVSSSYDATERGIIAKAMNEIQAHSCISFVPKVNHRNYIHIIKSSGCSSTVGMKGNEQAVTLDTNCVYHGVVIHELMHALGLWHEHSRFDRDSHIKILYQNVANKMEYNFEKYGKDKIEINGVPYDLESLMHYGGTAFAKDPSLKTIVPLVPNSNMGQRRGMSVYDKKKLKIMYCEKNSVTGGAPVSLGDCANTHPDCEMWAMTKQCEENPNYMLVSCCKACQSRCKDRDANCKAWAATGECTKNPNYMTVYCIESCGLCPSATGELRESVREQGKVVKERRPKVECRNPVSNAAESSRSTRAVTASARLKQGITEEATQGSFGRLEAEVKVEVEVEVEVEEEEEEEEAAWITTSTVLPGKRARHLSYLFAHNRAQPSRGHTLARPPLSCIAPSSAAHWWRAINCLLAWRLGTLTLAPAVVLSQRTRRGLCSFVSGRWCTHSGEHSCVPRRRCSRVTSGPRCTTTGAGEETDVEVQRVT
ncbi:hypothetical protein O3P69_006522 [Scylla paramamosain]|uniref:Metalloendopeptidase n=1 Tax=Scylla paramamosain TaxID=85552 RepID=A0AAW0U7P6_SCYPA